MRFSRLRWLTILAVVVSALPWEVSLRASPCDSGESSVLAQRASSPWGSENPQESDPCPSKAFCLCCATPSAVSFVDERIGFEPLPAGRRSRAGEKRPHPLGNYGVEVFHPPERD